MLLSAILIDIHDPGMCGFHVSCTIPPRMSSVTPVFRVRIVDPLDAATAEKWQGRPRLAFANGVGGIWMFWNLLNASLKTIFDAAVSDDRVHLRIIAVPLRPGTAPSNLSRLFRGSVQ